MTARLRPEEPPAGPWAEGAPADLLPVDRRPLVVAIDGRSGAGKSTLAGAVAALVPGSAVVHTDDLAWHEPLFGWAHLLRDVLLRVRAGEAVHLVPPAWTAHGRSGAITVAASAPLLVVEGTGAAQQAVADLVDRVIWVQSDLEEAERQALLRDVAQGENGGPAEARAFWNAWSAVELPFFARDRPWERADAVTAGTGVGPRAPSGRVRFSAGPLLPVSGAAS